MSTWIHRVSVGLISVLGLAQSLPAAPPAIGETIGDLRFKDIRALPRSMTDLGRKRAYVFVFTTTSCPLVRRSIPKLTDLDARYASQDVQIVAVNVGADDTIRDMAGQAIELEAAFPFVKDSDRSCATALGVTRTPGVAVLDADRKLVYRGRIDDQLRLGGSRPEPSRKDLEEAIREVLEGKPVSVAETPVDGCAIEAPAPLAAAAAPPTFHQHDPEAEVSAMPFRWQRRPLLAAHVPAGSGARRDLGRSGRRSTNAALVRQPEVRQVSE
jgi:thiol-disulfide isomerase/thioredoxin